MHVMNLNKKTLFFLFILLLTDLNLFAGESSIYNFSWLDPDKKIFVLQNRKFRKDGRFFFHGGLGMETSGAFTESLNVQGRFNYFFHEEWGLELLYSKNDGEENSAAKTVRLNANLTGSIPFRRITDDYSTLMAIWSPFYAKMNTFDQIIYMDIMFGLGLTKLNETNNRNELLNINGRAPINEKHTGYSWQISILTFLTTSFDVRVDLTGTHYKAQKALVTSTDGDKEWYDNIDATISVGIKL